MRVSCLLRGASWFCREAADGAADGLGAVMLIKRDELRNHEITPGGPGRCAFPSGRRPSPAPLPPPARQFSFKLNSSQSRKFGRSHYRRHHYPIISRTAVVAANRSIARSTDRSIGGKATRGSARSRCSSRAYPDLSVLSNGATASRRKIPRLLCTAACPSPPYPPPLPLSLSPRVPRRRELARERLWESKRTRTAGEWYLSSEA